MKRSESKFPADRVIEALSDKAGAAEFFGVSERTIDNFVTRGLLRPVRIPQSRIVRFRPETLRKLAESFETPTSATSGSR